LSASSTDTHAKAWPPRSAHCDSRVVLPYPAGATTETTGYRSPSAIRPIRAGRRTVPGRSMGWRSFDTRRSNAGRPVRRNWPPRSGTSSTPTPQHCPPKQPAVHAPVEHCTRSSTQWMCPARLSPSVPASLRHPFRPRAGPGLGRHCQCCQALAIGADKSPSQRKAALAVTPFRRPGLAVPLVRIPGPARRAWERPGSGARPPPRRQPGVPR